MKLDLKKFTEDYVKALRESDGKKLVELIAGIETEEERTLALDSVIKAIEADKELLSESPKLIEVLDEIKKKSAEESKEKEAVVEAPSLQPVTPKVEETTES